MLYDLSMSESNKYENLKSNFVSTVYVIQEIAGTKAGNPKINIMLPQTKTINELANLFLDFKKII